MAAQFQAHDEGSVASALVGIVTHNRAQELEKALASALTQSFQPVRVRVIDDASSDHTPTLSAFFPTVDWERRERPEGYLRARNYMMLSAREKYYVSLDDDSWFMDGDELAVAIEFLESNPRVAALAFDVLSPDQPAARPRGLPRQTATFIGCGVVLRLSAVNRIGGYVELPGYYGSEETDLSLRLIALGYDIVTIKGLHVWHEKTVRARQSDKQYRSLVCNDLVVKLWRAPLFVLPLMLSWTLLGHLRFATANKLLRPCLEGAGDFVRALPQTVRWRAPVPFSTLWRQRCLAMRGN